MTREELHLVISALSKYLLKETPDGDLVTALETWTPDLNLLTQEEKLAVRTYFA